MLWPTCAADRRYSHSFEQPAPDAHHIDGNSEIHRPLAIVYIGGFLIAILFEQILLPLLYEAAVGEKKESTA